MVMNMDDTVMKVEWHDKIVNEFSDMIDARIEKLKQENKVYYDNANYKWTDENTARLLMIKNDAIIDELDFIKTKIWNIEEKYNEE